MQEEATYVEGYENGPSVVNFLSGKREERSYEGGVLTGPAVVYGTDGDKFEFTYVEGKIQGTVIFRYEIYQNSNKLIVNTSFNIANMIQARLCIMLQMELQRNVLIVIVYHMDLPPCT